MEILKGNVVPKPEEIKKDEPVKEVELLTNPVAVNPVKLSFGAIPAIQTVSAVILGAVLWYMKNSGGEAVAMAEEIIRRITGG